MEIERKFLVKKMPELSGLRVKHIEQGYLCEEAITLRVRAVTEGDRRSYILTYKERVRHTGTARVHREEEFEIPEESFRHLYAKADGYRIIKDRYLIPLPESGTGIPGLTAELDVFHGVHEGIVIAEVEFPDEDSAERFTAPDWFGGDVSGESRYTNSCMVFEAYKA